jgi:uncharacterized protein YjbI with pentapeptide repeats
MKQNRKFLLGIVLGMCIAVAICFLYLNDFIKEKYVVQIQLQQSHIDQQATIIDSSRHTGLINMMNLVLENVSKELGETQERKLRNETVEQIASLSYSFTSHKYLDHDGIPANVRSPERGQLLLLLTSMRIDSASWNKIMAKTSFAGALLRDADLQGTNLAGANLQGADLQDAKLKGANLNAANLSFANLWGADLRQAKLIGANLKRADLSWSMLNEADLNWVNLQDAVLVATEARNTSFRGAFLQWADFSGAMLNESNLANTDMFRVNLKKAHLENADLTGSILTYAIMSEANLKGINLTDAVLTNLIISDQHWLVRLDEWQVKGALDIQDKYKMIEAYSYENSKYQLIKTGN